MQIKVNQEIRDIKMSSYPVYLCVRLFGVLQRYVRALSLFGMYIRVSAVPIWHRSLRYAQVHRWP